MTLPTPLATPVPAAQRKANRKGQTPLQHCRQAISSCEAALALIAAYNADEPTGSQLWPDWFYERVARRAAKEATIRENLAREQAREAVLLGLKSAPAAPVPAAARRGRPPAQ